jgi:hypothetical protein
MRLDASSVAAWAALLAAFSAFFRSFSALFVSIAHHQGRNRQSRDSMRTGLHATFVSRRR